MNDKEMLCYGLGMLENMICHDDNANAKINALIEKLKKHIETKKEEFVPSPPFIYPRFDGGQLVKDSEQIKASTNPNHLGW